MTDDQEAPLTVGELGQLLGLLLGALIFITLIVVDIRKAVKKGNFGVPGHALVLSALTIQLMNFVEDRSALFNRAVVDHRSNCTDAPNWCCTTDVKNSNCSTDVAKVQGKLKFIQFHTTLCNHRSKPLMLVESEVSDKNDDPLKDILFMVHCSRVMLCVLIAFFLPGMARPGYEKKWTTIAALGFTVFLHIFSELLGVRRKLGESGIRLVSYFFYFSQFYQIDDLWVILYGAIISGSLVWLLQLLICATIANKGIRNITLHRIPFHLRNPSENSWKAVADQVLKSWIVARSCSPESIIASSALASSAALSVTTCLLLSIIGWIIQGPLTRIHAAPGYWIKFIIAIMEILFSFIGGAIIGWRWLTSVVYYGRWRRKQKKWRDCFRVEDYWTTYILELQKTEESPMLKRLNAADDKRANQISSKEGKSRKVPWFLLQCVFWLQWFIVFFSKGYWFVSELVFSNKLIHKVAKMILSKHLTKVDTEFEKYKKLLYNVSILSETPRSVFLTNRKSIKQAQGIMNNGERDGKESHALISFLVKHRRPETYVGIPCLNGGTAHDQTRLKFLWKRVPESTLIMERYLIHPGKQSWKLTAVFLIRIVSRIGGDSCDTEYYLKVYQDAWELMDLVEETDPETDSLLSKVADGEFMALRDHISGQNGQRSASATTLEEASAAIQGLAEEANREAKEAETKAGINKSPEQTKRETNEADTPVDWKKLAAGATLYNICISMDCSSGDLKELKKELQSTLAHILGACIEKVGVALVENSRKWAEEMEETKLLEAIYIAGKTKGMMDQLGWNPNLRICPITEEPGCRGPRTEESDMA